MSRDYLVARTCYKQSNAFLLRRRRRRSAVSPWNVDPLRSTTLRGIRSARSGLGRQRSFRSFLCPTPKVTPRSSLGDVGEARWPLSHRWTDTSSTLPDAAHDSRNQGRVVSLYELSLLSACVRLCQLREVHHSLQQSLNPWSRTQSAATDGSPACCTSSLMLRVCVMLRVLDPLDPPCVRCLCCCCTNSGACLVWPVLFGALYAVAGAFCLGQMLGAL